MDSSATQQAFKSDRELGSWCLADTAFCLAIAIILYFRFFRFPAIPINPAAGDQSIFLLGATRMLEGQVIYRDFFQFNTPGTEYLYFALLRLFGQTASLPKLVAIFVGLAYAALGLCISRRVLSGWRVYLGPLVFLPAGFIASPDMNHHAFSTLAILGALALLLRQIDSIEGKPQFHFAAGALCAISLFFTPTRGVLALLGFTLMSFQSEDSDERHASVTHRHGSRLLIGFFVTLIFLVGAIVWVSGVQNFWKSVVGFTFHNYRTTPWNDLRCYGIDIPISGFDTPTAWSSLGISTLVALIKWFLIYFINPGIYVLFAADLWRKRNGKFQSQERKLLLIGITGIALFLSIAYAPTMLRMGIISMPGAILIAWLLRSDRTLPRITALTLTFFTAVTIPAGILHSQRHTATVIETPTGKVAITGSEAAGRTEEYSWLSTHTQAGMFVLSPTHPEYYYLFRLRNPGPVPFLTIYDYSTPEQVRETIAGIERNRVQYIFWPVDLQAVTRSTDAVPANQDHLNPIRDLLHKKYRLVKTFSDFDELWQRNEEQILATSKNQGGKLRLRRAAW